MRKNETWSHLQTLNLESNSLQAQGALELSLNTTWINLQSLNLRNNAIGAKGAAELGKNKSNHGSIYTHLIWDAILLVLKELNN